MSYLVTTQELYDLGQALTAYTAFSSVLMHSTNWLVYAFSMKQFREDLFQIICSGSVIPMKRKRDSPKSSNMNRRQSASTTNIIRLSHLN